MQEEGWVICRAFKKRTSSQTKTIEGWDTGYFYDEQASGVSSVLDPINLISRQPPRVSAQNLLCKQEIEADNNLSFMYPEQLVQLPRLESPSLPLAKRQRPMSLISDHNEDDDRTGLYNNETTKQVTDWRALDKFVASQLSQEDKHETVGVSNFESYTGSNMALLLHEENKLSPFLGTSSDCDIGICVFEN